MPRRKQLSRYTQGFTTTGDARTHRPDRGIYDRCSFGVCHALQSDEQNYRLLLLGQLGDSTLQVAYLEPYRLVGRKRYTRMGFLQFHGRALPRVPACAADVLTVQDRKHPCPQIGPLLPEADFLECAGDAVLDKILGRRDITRQDPRIAPQSRKDG